MKYLCTDSVNSSTYNCCPWSYFASRKKRNNDRYHDAIKHSNQSDSKIYGEHEVSRSFGKRMHFPNHLEVFLYNSWECSQAFNSNSGVMPSWVHIWLSCWSSKYQCYVLKLGVCKNNSYCWGCQFIFYTFELESWMEYVKFEYFRCWLFWRLMDWRI